MWGNREVMQALYLISKQVNHVERMTIVLLNHSQVSLPPELVKAGQDLDAKTKALQAALDAQ